MAMVLYFLLVNILLVGVTQGVMTDAQVAASQKMVRRACKGKVKITSDDELDGMRSGKWDNISPVSKCYLQCCLKMFKMVAGDGYVDYDATLKQVNNLPEPRRHLITESLNNCKDAGKTLTDKCEIAYEISKCFYDDNPEVYLMP